MSNPRPSPALNGAVVVIGTSVLVFEGYPGAQNMHKADYVIARNGELLKSRTGVIRPNHKFKAAGRLEALKREVELMLVKHALAS